MSTEQQISTTTSTTIDTMPQSSNITASNKQQPVQTITDEPNTQTETNSNSNTAPIPTDSPNTNTKTTDNVNIIDTIGSNRNSSNALQSQSQTNESNESSLVQMTIYINSLSLKTMKQSFSLSVRIYF